MTQHVKVKTKLFRAGASLPEYHSEGAAGADIRAYLENIESDHPIWNFLQVDAEGAFITIPGRSRVLIPTGLAFEVPPGFEMQVRSRSGLAHKNGLFVLNSPGTVDSDYRGEVAVIMLNTSDFHHRIRHGERVAQVLLAPAYRASFDEELGLSPSARGDGAYGSTGNK